jgi:hypothetical protein
LPEAVQRPIEPAGLFVVPASRVEREVLAREKQPGPSDRNHERASSSCSGQPPFEAYGPGELVLDRWLRLTWYPVGKGSVADNDTSDMRKAFQFGCHVLLKQSQLVTD